MLIVGHMLVGHIHDDGENMVCGTRFENGEEKLFQFFGAEFGHSESVIEMGHSIEYEMRGSEKRKIVGVRLHWRTLHQQ